MFNEKQRALLAKPLIARMATIDAQGYPHVVPVWFMLDGDDVVVFSYAKTRKVAQARANARGALTVGGDPAGTEGYLLKGDWVVEADNGWSQKITAHYEGAERTAQLLQEWGAIEYAVLRLKVRQVFKVS